MSKKVTLTNILLKENSRQRSYCGQRKIKNIEICGMKNIICNQENIGIHLHCIVDESLVLSMAIPEFRKYRNLS